MKQDLISLLQNELMDRCRKNSNYSLRSFAKSLGIDQSLLSKILSRKRPLTEKTKAKVTQILGLPFGDSFTKERNPMAEYHKMTEDHLMVISDWHHFAILELLQIKSTKQDVRWMASRLGANPNEVKFAIQRLLDLKYLKKDKQGRLRPSSPNNTWTVQSHTNEARKRLQKQLLEKAIASIDSVNLEERENGSLTVAVDKGMLPEIKNEIQNFKIKLRKLIENRGDANEVYQLCVSFFPLTESKE